MPRLSEVLKSVLVDLAQARAASDFFSADLATAYNADPVLRNLPVPRADISRYPNFSMRFSMNEVANLDAILQKWQHPILDQAVELAIENFLSGYDASFYWYESEADAILRSGLERKRQKRELSLLFLNNLTLIKTGNASNLERFIVHIMSWSFSRSKEFYYEPNIFATFYEARFARFSGLPWQALNLLEQQGPEIPFDPAEVQADLARFANAGDFDVDVDPAILQNLPDNTTSNITFSSNLRNYVWTEVPNPENNGEVELQLLPE